MFLYLPHVIYSLCLQHTQFSRESALYTCVDSSLCSTSMGLLNDLECISSTILLLMYCVNMLKAYLVYNPQGIIKPWVTYVVYFVSVCFRHSTIIASLYRDKLNSGLGITWRSRGDVIVINGDMTEYDTFCVLSD